MKQEAIKLETKDKEMAQNIDEDFVEDFARQLDSIVRIQDDNREEVQEEEELVNEDTYGYQQIPQDEDMYQQLMSDEEEEEVEEADLDAPLVIEVEPSNQLNSETSDLIKSIMSNIQLSNDAIPDWAKKIPEDAWLPRVKDN